MNARCDTINIHQYILQDCPILKSNKRTREDCDQYINCTLNFHYQHVSLFASFHSFGGYEPITLYSEGERI